MTESLKESCTTAPIRYQKLRQNYNNWLDNKYGKLLKEEEEYNSLIAKRPNEDKPTTTEGNEEISTNFISNQNSNRYEAEKYETKDNSEIVRGRYRPDILETDPIIPYSKHLQLIEKRYRSLEPTNENKEQHLVHQQNPRFISLRRKKQK